MQCTPEEKLVTGSAQHRKSLVHSFVERTFNVNVGMQINAKSYIICLPASPLTHILLNLTKNHTDYFQFFYYLFKNVRFLLYKYRSKSLFCKYYENTSNSMCLHGMGARNVTAPRDTIPLNPALYIPTKSIISFGNRHNTAKKRPLLTFS